VTSPHLFKKKSVRCPWFDERYSVVTVQQATTCSLNGTENWYLCDRTQNYVPEETVQPWSFLILALDEGTYSASGPGSFNPIERFPGTH